MNLIRYINILALGSLLTSCDSQPSPAVEINKETVSELQAGLIYPDIMETLNFQSFECDSIQWSDSSQFRLTYSGNIDLITRDSLRIQTDSISWDQEFKIELFGDMTLLFKNGIATCTRATFEFDSIGKAVNFNLTGLKGDINFGK